MSIFRFKDSDFNQKSESAKKVVEFPLSQKKDLDQQNLLDVLQDVLAIEAITGCLTLKKYPLSSEEVLKLLGLYGKKEDGDKGYESKDLELFIEKRKSKKSRGMYSEKIEVLSFIKKNDLSEVGNWVEELKMKLDYFYSHYPVDMESPEAISHFFKFIEDDLKRWYFNDKSESIKGCADNLKNNGEILYNKVYTRFTDVVGEAQSQKSSVKETLKVFEELEENFKLLEENYLNYQRKYLVKEKGNWITYNKFLSELKEGAGQINVIKKNFAIAKNTLLNQYKYKIEAQSYFLAASMVKKLAEINQLYLKCFLKTEVLLEKIKSNLIAKVQIEETDLLWALGKKRFQEKKKLEDVLKIVEKKLGHTLLSWGRFEGLTEELIRDKLFEEIKPISYQIAMDIHNKLDSELSQKNVGKFNV